MLLLEAHPRLWYQLQSAGAAESTAELTLPSLLKQVNVGMSVYTGSFLHMGGCLRTFLLIASLDAGVGLHQCVPRPERGEPSSSAGHVH